MSNPMPLQVKRQRSLIFGLLPMAIFLSAAFVIGSAFLVIDYKQSFSRLRIIDALKEDIESKICKNQCRSDGSESLPKGIVTRTSNLEMRPLWGHPKKKNNSKLPMSLLAMAVGKKQKTNVNEIVKKIMTNAASKKKTVGMQGSGRMIDQGSCYPQVTRPVLQNGNSTSSLARLPKVVRRPGPISNITTERAASLGVNCDKTETDNAKVGGKGTQVPKSTGLAGCRAVPMPALSSKSSSSASFGAIKEATKSSFSCDSSSSSLSNNICESLPSYYGELAIQEN